MNKIAAKLSLKEKIGYGVGDTASHFVWDMVGFWILIFYTDTFGISAAAAGTIMLIARFWDMISDPIMGVIAVFWDGQITLPTAQTAPWLVLIGLAGSTSPTGSRKCGR